MGDQHGTLKTGLVEHVDYVVREHFDTGLIEVRDRTTTPVTAIVRVHNAVTEREVGLDVNPRPPIAADAIQQNEPAA
jgi:hypothetical protein